MGFCVCSIFCCTLLCVLSSLAIILTGKRELVALLCLSSWCLCMHENIRVHSGIFVSGGGGGGGGPGQSDKKKL